MDGTEPWQVRVLRAELGKSQGEFAKDFRVNRNTVARWESGTQAPRGPAVVLLNQMWVQFKGKSAASQVA
jgi:DNA-binding transcriptional regulator YiaG